MWGSVEIRDLETLLVLAEELHFGKAAERLGVSTARVSQTIQALERRLNGPLFERTSRRVVLTLAGQRIVDRLGPIVAGLDDSLAEAAALNSGMNGTLRIGHILTVEGATEVERLVAEFEQRAPTARVLRLRYDYGDYIEWLHRDEVDIWLSWWPVPAPTEDPEAGLLCGPPVESETAVLLVGRKHPLAGETSIGLEDLVEHPLIELPTTAVPRLFQQQWLPRTAPSGRPVATVVIGSYLGHFHELAPVLDEGKFGWLTISRFLRTVAMPRGIVAVPVRDAPDYVLVPWYRDDRPNPMVDAFLSLIGPLRTA